MKLEDKAKKNIASQEEEKKSAEDRNKFMINNKSVYRRYAVGNNLTYEFGLYHEEQNVKIEIKNEGKRILIDDRCYNSQKNSREIKNTPYTFEHKPRGWLISLGYKVPEGKEEDEGYFTLEVNDIDIA